MMPHPIGPIEAQARAAAIARRNRLLGSPIAKRPAPVLRVVEKVEARPEPPVEPVKAKPKRKRKNMRPVEFIADRCEALGVSFDDIMADNRRKPIVAARDRIIGEVSKKYNLNAGQIGKLFGKDRTSIMNSLSKIGQRPRRPCLEELHKAQIVTMLNQGMMFKEISAKLEISPSTVSLIAHRHWPHAKIIPRIKDSAGIVREMFDRGETIAAIGAEIGSCPSAVSKFIKRNGWTRP